MSDKDTANTIALNSATTNTRERLYWNSRYLSLPLFENLSVIFIHCK